MWPHDYNFNQPVLLITTPVIQPISPLPRFQNMSSFPQNSKIGNQNVINNVQQRSWSRNSSFHKSGPSNVKETSSTSHSVSSKDLIEAFKKFEVLITDKVNDLVEKNRKMERRVITTIGVNIEATNEKYVQNKSMFLEFKTELEEQFARFEAEQKKLLGIMQCGMNEIKCALGQTNASSGDFKIDSTIMQLSPKFDETFKNNPISFLNHFETFVKSLRLSPALQRLLFIYAVQLDNPIWRKNVANIETYEGLKTPFLNVTWSRKQQTRVYLEFEKASFKDLSPEQINIEVKKWCDIVQNMDNVDFRNFRLSLVEKLPRHWQATLRVFAINNFDSLIRNIDLCLDNESVIPTLQYVQQKTDSN